MTYKEQKLNREKNVVNFKYLGFTFTQNHIYERANSTVNARAV
jgi:hypothetical protein